MSSYIIGWLVFENKCNCSNATDNHCTYCKTLLKNIYFTKKWQRATNLRPWHNFTALLGFRATCTTRGCRALVGLNLFIHEWDLITRSILGATQANSQLHTRKKCNLFEHRLGASTVRLQAVGAFASPLALLSLDIAWIVLQVAQLAAPFNEKWVSPSMLPFPCTLYAPALPLFFLSRICRSLCKACFLSEWSYLKFCKLSEQIRRQSDGAGVRF